MNAINAHNSRLTPLRYDQRDRITHLGELQYSVDDDGFLRQRANDLFDYNSNGLLTRVFNRVTERSVWYRYDGLGRRVATKSSQGEQLQFFYADLSHPTRVSHLYNHSSNLITSLYYDLQGHLIAMELSSGEEYYVACDSVGSPRAVFSSKGRLVKEILYTPYGEVYQDTNPDFQLVIGFHGGLYDPLTRLVHLGRRDYDTLAGRWTSPNHELWGELSKEPKPFNVYAFKNNCPVGKVEEVTEFTTGELHTCTHTHSFTLQLNTESVTHTSCHITALTQTQAGISLSSTYSHTHTYTANICHTE